jgi:hypothetical protein
MCGLAIFHSFSLLELEQQIYSSRRALCGKRWFGGQTAVLDLAGYFMGMVLGLALREAARQSVWDG